MKKIFVAAAVLCAAALCAHGGNVSVYNLGGFKFYALNNNTGAIPENLIASKIPFKKMRGWNENALNYFLLDTGKIKILFDAGTSAANGGKVVERLKEAGFTPTDINIVCLTHMHGDHIGGMLDAEDKKVFPHARVMIALEEARYFEESGNAQAAAVLKEYEENITKVPQIAEITPGVTSVPLFGHTPGHTGYMIDAGGKKLLVWGDLVHFLGQFKNPDLYLSYDTNPAAATEMRKTILRRAAAEGFYVAGMHVVKPGAGSVAESGAQGLSFTFIPGIK
ncbi:MAG: MBL fold metallo-hydrolase [Elusimicrobium sp.]|jgi:glyoxylase-like metal-dependent hydrolase (beta-lactamase superfamily II)|nr:MBL fold metallo-hydrolase [Elusimicrobium sp.]